MAIEELDLDRSVAAVPADVAALLAEADKRIDVFFDTERNRRIPRYIPGDALILYAALESLTRRDVPIGRVYCEWGSGFGVGACLARLLGYEAYGIEIEPELVDISKALASDHKLPVEILCTSYIPEGFDSYSAVGGEELMRCGDNPEFEPVYEGMDRGTDEIDIFYVYPWPGEQEFMQKLFDAVAVEGAILIIYYGDGDISAYRKVYELKG